jgi:hypothetical protein
MQSEKEWVMRAARFLAVMTAFGVVLVAATAGAQPAPPPGEPYPPPQYQQPQYPPQQYQPPQYPPPQYPQQEYPPPQYPQNPQYPQYPQYPQNPQYPQYPQYPPPQYPPPQYVPPPQPPPIIIPQPDPYARSHFYLGVAGVGVAVLDQTGPRAFLQAGGGFELTVGARLGRLLALEANWQPTFHNNQVDIFGNTVNTVGLNALTGDLKLFLLHGSIQPYFTVGAGFYSMGNAFSNIADGVGWEIGGGVDFWLGRFFTLGLKAQYRGVALFDYDLFNDNTYLSLFTGSANVGFHF